MRLCYSLSLAVRLTRDERGDRDDATEGNAPMAGPLNEPEWPRARGDRSSLVCASPLFGLFAPPVLNGINTLTFGADMRSPLERSTTTDVGLSSLSLSLSISDSVVAGDEAGRPLARTCQD